MPDWSDRVDRLLFEGETVEAEREVGSATVVVTSHRVLAFTPQADGADYRAVDRPNVRGVERQSVSAYGLVPTALKVGAFGALLALFGLVVDPEALLPRPDVSDAPGTGGVLGVIDTVIGLFHALDAVLLGLGSLLLVIAVGLAGLELATRRERVAIEVAGEDDVAIPGSVDDERLRTLDADLAPPDESAGPTDGPADSSADSTADRAPADPEV